MGLVNPGNFGPRNWYERIIFWIERKRLDYEIWRFKRARASGPCVTVPYSSRSCERGTKGCEIRHKAKRIAEAFEDR